MCARDKFYTCGECVLDEWCIRDWGGIFILKYTCTIFTHSERTGSSPWSRRLLPNHVNYCVSLSILHFIILPIGCVVVVFESRFLGASAVKPQQLVSEPTWFLVRCLRFGFSLHPQ